MKNHLIAHICGQLSIDNVVITKPKDPSHGHFATPIAFSLAKEEKKNPNLVASDLASKLSNSDMFDSVKAVGGFINFTLSDSFLDNFSTKALKESDLFGSSTHSEKILLEYVSANPTGPLHIGHARGALFGNALLLLGRHLGYKIDSEYYINDAGNQVELLAKSVHFKGRIELLGESVAFPDECYQGEYILELASKAQKIFGNEIFKPNATLDQMAVWAKDMMMDWVKSTLKDAGIEFDIFVSEKSLYSRWGEIEKRLEKNSALYKDSENKIWLASSQKGDGKDRVVVRENGIPTYLAGDIIYHADKFARSYDHYINIWGADHHGYIPRVKAAIEFLGYDSNRLEVLLAQMVALLKGGEPYKMSKRSGNFVTMEEVGADVGFDALKFIFLTKRSDTHLEFDIDSLEKQDSSNPVYYVNYAHARICSLFEKMALSQDKTIDVRLNNLAVDTKDLLFSALSLPEVIKDSFASRQPHLMTEFLYKLAGKTHRFYTENRVIGSQNEQIYLKVLSTVALSLRVGLKLLGITAKTKM